MRNISNARNNGLRVSVIALLVAMTAALSAAQQPTSGQTPSGQTPSGQTLSGQTSITNLSGAPIIGGSDNRYRIGPGDLLSVDVLDYPQLSSGAIRVDNRGMILLPMLEGEIPAACRTEGELAKEIAVRYLKYLKQPQIKVFVREYQSQPVAVLGAVNSPGRFLLQRRLRLLELLTYVQGPDLRAGRSIQIIHAGTSQVCEGAQETDQVSDVVVSLNLSETMRGIEAANPFVQAGDIITVPEADQYYLMGNVAKPAAYPLKEAISLTQAIVIAGGTLPDTRTDKVKIIRQASQGAPRTEIVVNLKTIAKQQEKEIMLQPNDVVEVPKASGASMVLKNALKSFLPMVTNLPMRVIY
jgi:polysaccharide biosynthesis/export protein